MENIKAKIDEAIQEVESKIRANRNRALALAMLKQAKDSVKRATLPAARSAV